MCVFFSIKQNAVKCFCQQLNAINKSDDFKKSLKLGSLMTDLIDSIDQAWFMIDLASKIDNKIPKKIVSGEIMKTKCYVLAVTLFNVAYKKILSLLTLPKDFHSTMIARLGKCQTKFNEFTLYYSKEGLAENMIFILKRNIRNATDPWQTVLDIKNAVKPNHCLDSVNPYSERKLTAILNSSKHSNSQLGPSCYWCKKGTCTKHVKKSKKPKNKKSTSKNSKN